MYNNNQNGKLMTKEEKMYREERQLMAIDRTYIGLHFLGIVSSTIYLSQIGIYSYY
jgi:uncharacterized membrane protein YkgB